MDLGCRAFPVTHVSAQSTFNSKTAQDEAVKFLSELVEIGYQQSPGNETRAAEYIKSVLVTEGIHAEIFESLRDAAT